MRDLNETEVQEVAGGIDQFEAGPQINISYQQLEWELEELLENWQS